MGDPKRKILMVMEPLTGGTLRHLETLAMGLDRDRFQLTLAVSFGRDPAARTRARKWEKAGVRVVEVPMRRSPAPIEDIRAVRRLTALIEEGAFDVIHTHSSKAGFLGRLAARISSFRGTVVHTPHVFPFQQPFGPVARRTFTALERRATRWTDHLVALTRYQELLALDVLPPCRGRMVRVPNGIDVQWFSPSDRAAARKALGIDVGRPAFAFVGRFCRQKGLDVLIEATERATQEVPRLLILHAGDLRTGHPLGPRIERLRAAGHFHSVGLVEDVRPVLAAADALAMPSRWEGMPFAALEAMAMARPVLGTGVSGMHEVIENERTGLLVPPEDPRAFAAGLVRLAQEVDVCQRLGQHAREAVGRWPLAGQIGELERLYSDGGRGAR